MPILPSLAMMVTTTSWLVNMCMHISLYPILCLVHVSELVQVYFYPTSSTTWPSTKSTGA